MFNHFDTLSRSERAEVAEILTPQLWQVIASYMDDDARETVHAEIAPCTEWEFLTRYLELDPYFTELLEIEFSIVID